MTRDKKNILYKATYDHGQYDLTYQARQDNEKPQYLNVKIDADDGNITAITPEERVVIVFKQNVTNEIVEQQQMARFLIKLRQLL